MRSGVGADMSPYGNSDGMFDEKGLLRLPNILVVVSGPSGAGKSTVCGELAARRPDDVKVVVSYTTRPKREGEQEGVDYHFIDEETFKRGIEEGMFLEYALVHGNYYGTPRRDVEEFLAAGYDTILEIDVQGGLQVKSAMPEAMLVFLTPSRFSVIEERLRARGTDSEETIRRRLHNARREFETMQRYEYLLLNDDLQEAVESLDRFIHVGRRRMALLRGVDEVILGA